VREHPGRGPDRQCTERHRPLAGFLGGRRL
jgi:hypothetical protein